MSNTSKNVLNDIYAGLDLMMDSGSEYGYKVISNNDTEMVTEIEKYDDNANVTIIGTVTFTFEERK